MVAPPLFRLAWLVTAAVLSACGNGPEQAAPTPFTTAAPTTAAPTTAAPTPAAPTATTLDTGPPEVLVTGLEAPWGIDFLPDGDALVTERDSARILRVPAAGGDPVEVTTVAQARPRGEGGLLGLAVAPDGETVYAYVTTAQDNRIVRFPLSDPDDVEPVLTGIPASSVHNGGRITFGPDGHLYAGTGDAGQPTRSQDPESLGGKVLRMTLDGEPVPGEDSLVFSRGHRNVQGLAFGPDDRLYAVEFGQNRFDEVNRVERGSNGGWPDVEGPGDGGGRFLAPITTWETSEASPSGAAVVGDTLYVAALRGQRLWQVPLADPGNPRALYEGEFGRLRAAARAPDGSLWVLTSNRDGRGDPVRQDDRILRLGVR
ncbi:MAG: PQQ-dependent sugar dehydrogenase [Mycobacteriales bacterium]